MNPIEYFRDTKQKQTWVIFDLWLSQKKMWSLQDSVSLYLKGVSRNPHWGCSSLSVGKNKIHLSCWRLIHDSYITENYLKNNS
jgi:hypothetical protein